MNILEGTYTTLRAPEPEDLEYFYQWENDSEVWQVSNTITPFSRYTLRQYIESSRLDIYETHQLRLMIDKRYAAGSTEKEGHRTIGTIDLFDFDPYHHRAGVGILIGEKSERGNGLAGDALKTLILYSFSFLKLHQLYCNISSDNQTSLKFFQKSGFEIAGTKKDWIYGGNGTYLDEYLLQLIKK